MSKIGADIAVESCLNFGPVRDSAVNPIIVIEILQLYRY